VADVAALGILIDRLKGAGVQALRRSRIDIEIIL
jgi:hypothetical protein